MNNEKIEKNLKEIDDFLDNVKCAANCPFNSVCDEVGDYLMPCEMIKFLCKSVKEKINK